MPSSSRRPALTLIEMIVTIAILGIVLSLAGPAVILRPQRNALEDAIGRARRAAVRRSQRLVLVVDSTGASHIMDPRLGSTVFSGSKVATGGQAVSVEISPLGICRIEEGSDELRRNLDPFTCALRDSREARR